MRIIHPDGKILKIPYPVPKLTLQMYEKGIPPPNQEKKKRKPFKFPNILEQVGYY